MPKVIHLGKVTGVNVTPTLDLRNLSGSDYISAYMIRGVAAATGQMDCSPDGSSWGLIPLANAFGSVNGVTNDEHFIVPGCLRFIRGVISSGVGAYDFYIVID